MMGSPMVEDAEEVQRRYTLMQRWDSWRAKWLLSSKMMDKNNEGQSLADFLRFVLEERRKLTDQGSLSDSDTAVHVMLTIIFVN